MAAAATRSEVEQSRDGEKTRYSYFPVEEHLLRTLMDHLFVENWDRIVVGPCLEGAVFEIGFHCAPKVTYRDGYVNVGLGKWHFQLCIGATRNSKSEELCRKRPVARAALFETRGESGCGLNWGIRFWNGFGEQMMTVFLPGAMLFHEKNGESVTGQADWSRLTLYYELRRLLLAEPVPTDLKNAAQRPW
jgi:hypothetical protein